MGESVRGVNVSPISFIPYGEKIDLNYGWIVYPWEKKDSETIQDYLVK